MKIFILITRMSRICPQSDRGDAKKLEFLHNAVVGYTWSLEQLNRFETHNIKFRKLYGELEDALKLEMEERIAQDRDSATSALRYDEQPKKNVYFIGQGRYVRNTSMVKREI